MDNKISLFEKYIHKSYGDCAKYESIRLNLLNIRETMYDKLEGFSEMSVKRQYDICEVTCIITVSSQRHTMSETQLLSENVNRNHQYSIDRESPHYELKTIKVK